MKHFGVWLLVLLGGFTSVYVAAQSSSVSIEANISSFVQYIQSVFITSDGTPNGVPVVSLDAQDGLSLYDIERQNAGPGLLGVNGDGNVVNTRPLSYVTLPDSPDVQQLSNNHSYIIPYWDDRDGTNVIFPSSCVIGDQIDILAMKLPLSMDTDQNMKIVIPYLVGEAGYGYGKNTYIEYDDYIFSEGAKYDEYCSDGSGPAYIYDWCERIRDEDQQNSSPSYGNGENPLKYDATCGKGIGLDYIYDWCYEERDEDQQTNIYNYGNGENPHEDNENSSDFATRKLSFLCIDEHKYLMTSDVLANNAPGDGYFYNLRPSQGYGDEYGQGNPIPF